jgi:hypothetical protein
LVGGIKYGTTNFTVYVYIVKLFKGLGQIGSSGIR